MKYLLDVNVLIAAIWKSHAAHSKADAWLKGRSLATCPFSELGFLRISTHSKGLGATMSDARKLLENFLVAHNVEFVPADMPALASNATKNEEVTDSYLAELAGRKNLKLATLDGNIAHPAAELIG